MTVTIVPEQNPAGEAHLEPFLTELVNESLNSYAYSNAVFLCERLHAASPTEVRVRSLAPIRPVHQRAPDRSDTTRSERSIGRVRDAWVRLPERSRLVVPKTTRSRLPPTTTHRPPDPPTALRSIYPHQANKHLLATCYYRHDQANRAYHTLKGCTSHRCRYLLALCCVKLRKLPEAEAALSHSALPAGGRPPATDSSAAERPASDASADVPNGAHGRYLLGVICKETGRAKAAIAHFADALASDPFMWSAYEELCALGAENEAEAGKFFLIIVTAIRLTSRVFC